MEISEKILEVVKTKLVIGEQIALPSYIRDKNTNYHISHICLTDDGELTCFAYKDSSDYFSSIKDLDEINYYEICLFLLNWVKTKR